MALQMLHDDQADYIKRNNLHALDNHAMRLAREALAQPAAREGESEPFPYPNLLMETLQSEFEAAPKAAPQEAAPPDEDANAVAVRAMRVEAHPWPGYVFVNGHAKPIEGAERAQEAAPPLLDSIGKADLWDKHFGGDEWPPMMHKRFAFINEVMALATAAPKAEQGDKP